MSTIDKQEDRTAHYWEFEMRVPIMLERRFKNYQGVEFTCSNFFVVPTDTPAEQEELGGWLAVALGYNKSSNDGIWRSCFHAHVEDAIIEALEASAPESTT